MSEIHLRFATDEEAEQSDQVVCLLTTTPLVLSDNLEAPCADCGRMLQHRPGAPKRPPKRCLECALARAEGGRA